MFILLLLWSYLCYCIRFVSFRLIVCYAHVLYSSSMCMVVFVYCIQAQCVWSCSCIVFKLIVYGRVHVLYLKGGYHAIKVFFY